MNFKHLIKMVYSNSHVNRLLFFIFFLHSLNAQAQGGYIKIRIVDTHLNPLPNVVVKIEGCNERPTDNYGIFRAELNYDYPPGKVIYATYKKSGWKLLDDTNIQLVTMNISEEKPVLIIMRRINQHIDLSKKTQNRLLCAIADSLNVSQIELMDRINKGFKDLVKELRQLQKEEELTPQDLFQLGNFYYEIENYSKAREFWYKSALLNNYDAQCSLGTIYLKAPDNIKNCKKAEKWLKRSAKIGNPLAQSNLGSLYYNGCSNISKNIEEALELFLTSAQKGEKIAQNNLGIMFRDCNVPGYTRKKSKENAFEWFKKSSENKYAPALYNLGIAYLKGEGCKKDKKKAYQLILLSSEFNYPQAIQWISKQNKSR